MQPARSAAMQASSRGYVDAFGSLVPRRRLADSEKATFYFSAARRRALAAEKTAALGLASTSALATDARPTRLATGPFLQLRGRHAATHFQARHFVADVGTSSSCSGTQA